MCFMSLMQPPNEARNRGAAHCVVSGISVLIANSGTVTLPEPFTIWEMVIKQRVCGGRKTEPGGDLTLLPTVHGTLSWLEKFICTTLSLPFYYYEV
ncbi:hypothetical protein RRG08_022248 [Elysia crispata]|uniref:Uncharacterized protein n=1 Tax=Elysia crispata TaxID=231223 RepID=A0AAE1DK25_9GAST|nr:hypothetical protein RRG08_022248 [Elysia crispata]